MNEQPSREKPHQATISGPSESRPAGPAALIVGPRGDESWHAFKHRVTGGFRVAGLLASVPIEQALRTDTVALASSAGRVPGTAGHDRAREYLEARFAELGLTSYPGLDGYRHTYRARDAVRMTNLIGVIPGTDRTLPPILVGAHYDSVIEAPCADDNAAAVAVMLQVAADLTRQRLDRDVIVAAFDAEEPPYYLGEEMGSSRFVADVLDRPVHLAVIMDLVGHAVSVPGFDLNPDLMFVVGAESHPALPGLLRDLRLPIAATTQPRVGDMSDYHAFRLAGAPYLFFSCGEWVHYHQPSDHPDLLDYPKMAQLTHDLHTVLQRADRITTSYHSPADTNEFEVATLEAAFGIEVMTRLAAMLCRPGYRSAADLDAIVTGLRGRLH